MGLSQPSECAEVVHLEVPLEEGGSWEWWSSGLASAGPLDLLSKDVRGGGAGNVPEHLPFLFCGSQRAGSEQLQGDLLPAFQEGVVSSKHHQALETVLN